MTLGLIAGASDATGREFARQIAAHGIHCILIARRASALADLAAEIERDWGVSCVIAAIDLASPGAMKQIAEAVGDRQVGLFVANAGATAMAPISSTAASTCGARSSSATS